MSVPFVLFFLIKTARFFHCLQTDFAKFEARPSPISSVVLTVKEPGTCVFCSIDAFGDIEMSEPVASAVTVTSSVSAELFEVSATLSGRDYPLA